MIAEIGKSIAGQRCLLHPGAPLPVEEFMGWRADAAYEKAQREDFLAWRRSLTWNEWLRWQADRHWAFALGAASVVVCWLLLG